MREFECVLVSGEDEKKIVKAVALGNLLKQDDLGLVVGDYVILDKGTATGEYIITERLERQSEVFRILIRENKRKVTAANIDVLIILMSVSRPAYKQGVLDRFLVRASQWEIPAVVVFNKMDDYDKLKEPPDLKLEKERLADLDVECFEISALDPHYESRFLENGIEEFKSYLKNKTGLFVGHSGVGKSQTISALSEGKVELKTKQVGKGGKGSHTTTWSELVDMGEFYLVDSPGIRSFSLDDIDPDELILYFPDLAKTAGHCEFFDCLHTENSKGCAFWEKFPIESDKGRLVHSRLESYRRIREEIGLIPHWQKKV